MFLCQLVGGSLVDTCFSDFRLDQLCQHIKSWVSQLDIINKMIFLNCISLPIAPVEHICECVFKFLKLLRWRQMRNFVEISFYVNICDFNLLKHLRWHKSMLKWAQLFGCSFSVSHKNYNQDKSICLSNVWCRHQTRNDSLKAFKGLGSCKYRIMSAFKSPSMGSTWFLWTCGKCIFFFEKASSIIYRGYPLLFVSHSVMESYY